LPKFRFFIVVGRIKPWFLVKPVFRGFREFAPQSGMTKPLQKEPVGR
jgi:hypothetical protein